MKTIHKMAFTVAALGISATTGWAALHLTFTEEGGNVVMRTSGSVELTDATWIRSRTTAPSAFYLAWVDQSEIVSHGDNWHYSDYFGVEVETLIDRNDRIAADSWSGDQFLLSTIVLRVDYGTELGGWAPVSTMTWNATTLAEMGLDQHAANTDVEIWKASSTSGAEGTIYLNVSEVPEPSSVVLLGLGAVGLLRRRRF